MEKKIADKEEELAQKEDELIEAQIDENNQYEDMKKRIKYMYENGNAEFLEILFQSETLSDFLNNAIFFSNSAVSVKIPSSCAESESFSDWAASFFDSSSSAFFFASLKFAACA